MKVTASSAILSMIWLGVLGFLTALTSKAAAIAAQRTMRVSLKAAILELDCG